MSLARLHRERMAALQAAGSAQAIASVAAGVSATDGVSSPAIGGHPVAVVTGANPVAAQMLLRLQQDLRRLKEIQSVERKIAAKRDMLPEYDAWIEGLLEAATETGAGTPDEILPTIMIWRIDTGDFTGALQLAEHVLRYHLPLPGRYERTAPTLIVEEIADAALAALGKGDDFDLDVLETVDLLTENEDIFDEVRAKLFKAKGLCLARGVDGAPGANARAAALANLNRARELHERCGVTKQIEKLQRAIRADEAAAAAEQNSQGDQPPVPPTGG